MMFGPKQAGQPDNQASMQQGCSVDATTTETIEILPSICASEVQFLHWGVG